MNNKTRPTPEVLASRVKDAETALMRDQDAARSRMEADLQGMIDTIKLNRDTIDGIAVVLVARPNRVLASIETGEVATVLSFSRGGTLGADQTMANVLELTAKDLRDSMGPNPTMQIIRGIMKGLE